MRLLQKLKVLLLFFFIPYTVSAQEVLFRTQSPVSSCAFSPDGRYFAAAWGKNVSFWDAASFSLLTVCSDYPDDVISIKFSSDSKTLLAVCGGNVLCMNSVENFKVSALLNTDFKNTVLDADFDSSSSILLQSDGKKISSYFLLKYSSQAVQKKLGEHNDTVFRIETAKLSKKPVTVSTSRDGQARVWDLSSYTLIKEFQCSVENALPAVISPDGVKIFYAGDKENLIVSDIDGSNPLTIAESGAVRTASFSGDGAFIAFAVKGGGIKVYNTVSGDIAAEISSLFDSEEKKTDKRNSFINSIAFSPVGNNIIIGCENGCLLLWNIDKKNVSHSGSAVSGAAGNNSAGSGAGEQSIGTGGSTSEQSAGQSRTGNPGDETGASAGAAESLQQQKNNSAHHVTVSAGIGSIDTNLYRFTLHLNAGYFYSVSSLFFFGGTLSLRDSLPADDFPYTYETPTEYLNPPSVYSVSVCACGGLEFYPKDFIRVFVQADIGANMRFLWNTSVSSSVAGTPRFGAVTSLFAGAEFWGARVGGGIEYDTNFGFSGYASVGYTFRFGTEKK